MVYLKPCQRRTRTSTIQWIRGPTVLRMSTPLRSLAGMHTPQSTTSNIQKTPSVFYPWSGNFNWRELNSRRHVFKDGETNEFVHDMSASLKTKDGYTSSSSIHVQAQYKDRTLRFLFGEFKTQNVFEVLSPAYCAYQTRLYTNLNNQEHNAPSSWGSWRRHSWWTYFTHHPLVHPHAQSLVESLAPLHGGYAYPNLDLSPEFALIESFGMTHCWTT